MNDDKITRRLNCIIVLKLNVTKQLSDTGHAMSNLDLDSKRLAVTNK